MSQLENQHNVSNEPAVDMMGLLGRCLGNFKMVERVLSTFRATGRSDLEQLERAIKAADFQATTDVSHRFQGAASNVSATRLRELLKRSERLAKEQNHTELLMLLGALQLEWDEFERQSQTLAPTSGNGSAGPVRKMQSSLETAHAGISC